MRQDIAVLCSDRGKADTLRPSERRHGRSIVLREFANLTFVLRVLDGAPGYYHVGQV